MDKLHFLFLLLTLSAHGLKEDHRIYFYSCHLARRAEDGMNFKEQFVFQLVEDRQKVSTVKQSLRWADMEISLSGSGNLKIMISETSKNGGVLTQEKNYHLPQFSIDNPSAINKTIVLSAPNKIIYSLYCL